MERWFKQSLTLCLMGAASFLIGPLHANPAQAQECPGGLCGAPNQSGGGCGCGCGCGCSVLIAQTDAGVTFQFADDFDNDGIEDDFDNCPFRTNTDQADLDGDGVGDSCDVCASVADPLQLNFDSDAEGDACDPDDDNDGVLDATDVCVLTPNPRQADTDGDLIGDACDTDDDDDGVLDLDDSCPLVFNDPGTGLPIDPNAACDLDEDADGINGAIDNCFGINNPTQSDIDGDGLGDPCDPDSDGDGIQNYNDNCRMAHNPAQVDLDRDGLGDAGNWPEGAESCDPSECYVVGEDAGACLNPDAAFEIQLAMVAPTIDLFTGDTLEVALFSNRLGGVLHNWTARFERLPGGSSATLFNARGSGPTLGTVNPLVQSCLEENGGQCVRTNAINFRPDEPGTYVIQVAAELPQGDPKGLGTNRAVATITAEVGGEGSGGCNNTSGTAGTFAAIALGLLFWVSRLRRID